MLFGKGKAGDDGKATPPLKSKVLGYLVETHLNHAKVRLVALETWVGEVLSLLADSDSDAASLFPSLSPTNFANFYGPFLSSLVAEFEASALDQTHGRDEQALIYQTHRLVVCFELALTLTKVPGLQTVPVLLVALREGRHFVEQFVKAMPLLRFLLKNYQEKVVAIWTDLQVISALASVYRCVH